MSSLRDHIERTLDETDRGPATETAPVTTGSIALPPGR
jgi:hypothetical protein